MPVIRTKQNGEWDRTTTRTPIDDTLTKKGYAADAAAVGAALANTDAVQYTEQTLTEAQQMQTRKNMGLYYSEEVPVKELVYEYLYTGWWECYGVDTLATGNGICANTYIIDVDGTQYVCEGVRDTKDYGQMVGEMGTASLGGGDCPVTFTHNVNGSGVENFTVTIDSDFKPSMGTTISVYLDTGEMVTEYDTIPVEYIPDSIARTSAIPTYTSQLENDSGFITADDIPSGGGITEESDPTVKAWAKTDIPATVGQYFRVSEVDESGNVTAVEAVDAPSGGGGETWRLVADMTVAETVNRIYISEDVDGKPFSLKEMHLIAYLKGYNESTGSIEEGTGMRVSINSDNWTWAATVYAKDPQTKNHSARVKCMPYYAPTHCDYINSNGAGIYRSTQSFDSITSVYFVANEKDFAAETRLILWGVDA